MVISFGFCDEISSVKRIVESEKIAQYEEFMRNNIIIDCIRIQMNSNHSIIAVSSMYRTSSLEIDVLTWW